MNHSNIILVLSFLVLFTSLNAQYDPLNSMYWNNYSRLNPANSGVEFKHFATVHGRDQLSTTNTYPKYIQAVYDYRIDHINSGIGLNYIYDKWNLNQGYRIVLNYNYQIRIKREHLISLGFGIGLIHSISGQESVYFNPYRTERVEDSDQSFSANLGMHYQYKRMKIGLSVKDVNSPELNHKYGQGGRSFSQIPKIYYLMTSYDLIVSPKFTLVPSVLYQSAVELYNEFYSYDVNLRVLYNNTFWVGATYRRHDNYVAMLGINIKQRLAIGYSNDIWNGLDTDWHTHDLYLTYLIK